MHLEFTRPSGLWPNEIVPGAADLRDLDYKQSKGIDGDDGGQVVTPATPIIIGGAGLGLLSPGTSSAATGGVTTKTGGRVYTYDATDFPVLNDRTRTITFPALRAGVSVGPNVSGSPSQLEESYIRPLFGSFGAGIAFPVRQPAFFAVNIPRRCMHHQAQLLSASIQYAITQRPTAVPTSVYPRFSVTTRDYAGNYYAGFPTPTDLLVNTWSSGTGFGVGVYVTPLADSRQNGFYFQVLSISGAGVSGSTEPVWPSVVGSTVVDNPGPNQITWICIGRSGIYPIGGASPDSYYSNGQVQSVYFDPDPAAISGNLVDDTTFRYQFYFPLAAIDPSMVLTSFTLSFGRIRLLGQE
jgi:hypothetical protein